MSQIIVAHRGGRFTGWGRCTASLLLDSEGSDKTASLSDKTASSPEALDNLLGSSLRLLPDHFCNIILKLHTQQRTGSCINSDPSLSSGHLVENLQLSTATFGGPLIYPSNRGLLLSLKSGTSLFNGLPINSKAFPIYLLLIKKGSGHHQI